MTPQSVDDRVTTYGSLLRACETAAVLLGGPQLVLQCGYGRCDPAWALSLYAARYIQLKRAHQAPGLRRVAGYDALICGAFHVLFQYRLDAVGPKRFPRIRLA